MLHAPTLAGVTVPHVVYVIGRGSSQEKIEMAVIGFDGKRYIMHARVGRYSPSSIRPG